MTNPDWYAQPRRILGLYHGTTSLYRESFETQGFQIVDRPDKRRDFGNGFYTTTNLAQAQDYATETAAAAGDEGKPLIVIPDPRADFLWIPRFPLDREYLADLVTGMLVAVMTNSVSANR